MPSDDYSLEVGDSFKLKNDYGIHLHVIVAEASPDPSATIFLVYISSADIPARDQTTIIQPGEHSEITKASWVRYQNVLICSRNEIRGLICEYFGKVDSKLLKRIQDGILNSDRVIDPNKELFQQWRMDKLYREMLQ